jgi:hypothetical protein
MLPQMLKPRIDEKGFEHSSRVRTNIRMSSRFAMEGHFAVFGN